MDYFRDNGVTTNDISLLMGMYQAKNPKDKDFADVATYYVVRLDGCWYNTFLKQKPIYTNKKEESCLK